MNGMRVLVVTPWYPTEAAPGSGVFNLRDVELLAEDHEVKVLHLVPPAAPLAGPVPGDSSDTTVERVPFSLTRPDSCIGAVRSIRRASADADVVHTMAFPALFPTSLARPECPWVHTEHWSGLVGPAPTLRARLGGAVLRPGLRRPDAVVAVGQTLADVIDRYRADPTAVIGNRVRLAPASTADQGALPQPPEQRGDAPLRLVGVGNLIAGKGPLEAVDALSGLREMGIDAVLEWAGTGALADEVLRRAETLGVADRLTLLGHVPPERLSEVLLRAHVFVLPTRGETFGVAIAEALGHGLPVVTSGAGGHLAFLPRAASRTVAVRSGGALAAALAELAADPGRWTPERIAEYARETFSEERRRDDYREVYARATRR